MGTAGIRHFQTLNRWQHFMPDWRIRNILVKISLTNTTPIHIRYIDRARNVVLASQVWTGPPCWLTYDGERIRGRGKQIFPGDCRKGFCILLNWQNWWKSRLSVNIPVMGRDLKCRRVLCLTENLPLSSRKVSYWRRCLPLSAVFLLQCVGTGIFFYHLFCCC